MQKNYLMRGFNGEERPEVVLPLALSGLWSQSSCPQHVHIIFEPA